MKSVFICGAGVSIQEGVETDLWTKLKESDIEVWSLNWAFKTMPYLPKVEMWIDIGFFNKTIVELFNLYKKGVICYAKDHTKYKDIPEIHSLVTTRLTEQYNEKVYIGSSGLTGFFALSIARKEKYDNIYLGGYDFGSLDGTKNTHYYQNTLKVPSNGMGHPELYTTKDAKITDWEIYLKEPCLIWNVSPLSRISCFNKIDYPTFYKMLKEIE